MHWHLFSSLIIATIRSLTLIIAMIRSSTYIIPTIRSSPIISATIPLSRRSNGRHASSRPSDRRHTISQQSAPRHTYHDNRIIATIRVSDMYHRDDQRRTYIFATTSLPSFIIATINHRTYIIGANRIPPFIFATINHRSTIHSGPLSLRVPPSPPLPQAPAGQQFIPRPRAPEPRCQLDRPPANPQGPSARQRFSLSK